MVLRTIRKDLFFIKLQRFRNYFFLSINFLSAMAPPAAASNPRPPIGVWVGALGKLGVAIIKDEKETINNKMLITLINSPIIISLYYTPPVLNV